METLMSIAVVFTICVLAPLFLVLHFITKWKQSREFSRDDEQMLEDLWQLSQRLNDRLETLERILDDDLQPRRRRHEPAHLEH